MIYLLQSLKTQRGKETIMVPIYEAELARLSRKPELQAMVYDLVQAVLEEHQKCRNLGKITKVVLVNLVWSALSEKTYKQLNTKYSLSE